MMREPRRDNLQLTVRHKTHYAAMAVNSCVGFSLRSREIPTAEGVGAKETSAQLSSAL